MNYDIFKHGKGVRVRNFRTNKYGVVQDIKETHYEYIEPFVLYDGEKNPVRASTFELVLEMPDDRNNTAQK